MVACDAQASLALLSQTLENDGMVDSLESELAEAVTSAAALQQQVEDLQRKSADAQVQARPLLPHLGSTCT